MSNPYEMFETDAGLEQDGQWIDYGDFEIKIAKAGGGNRRYVRIHQELMKPYERRAAVGALDEETARPVLAKIYAKAVVLDWKGVTDRDGAPLPFSEQNVASLLCDLPALFADLINIASNDQAWKAFAREEQAKNS